MSTARGVPEDEVRAFLAERHGEQAELALWLRDVIRNAEPDLTERVYRGWDGIGYRHPDAGYVCAIYIAVADDRDDPEALGRYVTAAVAQRLFRP